jgi:hypothetical protein
MKLKNKPMQQDAEIKYFEAKNVIIGLELECGDASLVTRERYKCRVNIMKALLSLHSHKP